MSRSWGSLSAGLDAGRKRPRPSIAAIPRWSPYNLWPCGISTAGAAPTQPVAGRSGCLSPGRQNEWVRLGCRVSRSDRRDPPWPHKKPWVFRKSRAPQAAGLDSTSQQAGSGGRAVYERPAGWRIRTWDQDLSETMLQYPLWLCRGEYPLGLGQQVPFPARAQPGHELTASLHHQSAAARKRARHSAPAGLQRLSVRATPAPR